MRFSDWLKVVQRLKVTHLEHVDLADSVSLCFNMSCNPPRTWLPNMAENCIYRRHVVWFTVAEMLGIWLA